MLPTPLDAIEKTFIHRDSKKFTKPPFHHLVLSHKLISSIHLFLEHGQNFQLSLDNAFEFFPVDT